MIPYKTSIRIDRTSKQAVYLQLTNQFISLIKKGILVKGAKLPSSRELALLISVHRKTVITCYEELILQGWIESIPQKGTYVHSKIPMLKQQKLGADRIDLKGKDEAGFSFKKQSYLDRSFPQSFNKENIYVNDGIGDVRLAPRNAIATLYRSISAKKSTPLYMDYGTTYGNLELRKTLVNYLNETRGLRISIDNIMITRGSQMSMFLAGQLLFDKDEYVIVGETNYSSSDTTFEYGGAKLLRIKIDGEGLQTIEIKKLCEKYKVKAVYTTPHHHHPTTVTLSAERRIQLLNLAKTYRFAIIEDDYDYDFHYNHSSILPLASHDIHNNVIYVGSVCKTVAPVYRVGYLIASKTFVDECAKLRRFIDRQGDALLELTFAEFIKDGSLDRHIKKTLKIYKTRRDEFCALLREELGDYFSFEIPKGGMAIWVTLDKRFSWESVAEIAKKENLIFFELQRYDMAKTNHNAIRIGFAAYNREEAKTFVHRLKSTMKALDI